MARHLVALVALVILSAGVWAALVTLFAPPLTLGWREFYQATARRWLRNLGAFGAVAAIGYLLWFVLLALR